MLYIVLRGHWCNIIVLNVHPPSEEKSDDLKDGFYKELGQVFDHLHKFLFVCFPGVTDHCGCIFTAQ